MVINRKRIVIVGGGYTGFKLTDDLKKKNHNNKMDIVVISLNNYFFHNVASPRCLVDETIAPQICLPLENKLAHNNVRFVHGKVIRFTDGEVKYLPIVNNKEDNKEETLTFDYLVLAFGLNNSDPFKVMHYDKSEQINALQEIHNKIKDAKRILIIGGGALGSETAGEIATDCPSKQVTLVTSADRLVADMDPSFSDKTLKILQQKNVQVILNDRCDVANLENFTSQKVTTRNGKVLEFDAYFVCVGVRAHADPIKNSFPECMDANGFVKVNKHLQVISHPNIFAIGDCCALDDPKMVLVGYKHASLVASNLNELVNNKGSRLSEYKVSTKRLMLLTLGRDNGVFRFMCFLLTGFMPRFAKARDMFIGKTKNEFFIN